ncbi:MAG: hypothetical protein EHM59_04405 [Betaproteobacteria bacterium]|nr:MAG: hypothetical protein EHM59_04405 [Betaproteobacteria bacterium]
MSDLQLGLILIGVLVVVGVYAFNRFQERQFRRRVESNFDERPPADVLLDAEVPRSEEERIEPHLGGGQEDASAAPDLPGTADSDAVGERRREAGPESGDESLAAPVQRAEAPASPIDYVCDIEAGEPIPHAALGEFLKAAATIGKPVSVIGWNARSNDWIALPCAAELALSRIQASLQLADRSGAINRVQLSTMRDLVHQFAEHVGGVSRCPEIDQAAHAAAEIDRFCAQVDISIGFNVIPNRAGGFPGTKVRGLLESAGFALESSGRFVLRAEDGTVLMSAENIEGEALSPDRLRAAQVPGLTLTMDVPRVPGGGRVFDRMIEIGRHLAQALDATVVDDNRARLTDAGINVIRQQLRSVHAAMKAQGIPAGGALAARLFS